MGVDLNRNYDFNFGSTEGGGSDNPCHDDYRGPNPFSESETQAVRDFVQQNQNFRIAVNLHGYRNIWRAPFFVNELFSDQRVPHVTPVQRAIYEEFFNQNKNIQANDISPITGDASSWMLATQSQKIFRNQAKNLF